MEISNLKQDSKAVEGGDWVDEIPGCGDLQLKVRGTNSSVYANYVARLMRKEPRASFDSKGNLKQEVSNRITAKAMADVILLDWKGLTEGGKPIPFDKDLAERWLLDPDTRPFADAVAAAAARVGREREDATEALEKN